MLAETGCRTTATDAEAITNVLVRAFDTDPIVPWFVCDDRRRAEGMRAFFGTALRITMPRGEVHLTPDATGTAL